MRKSWIIVLALAFAAPAVASEIGQVKVAKGAVQVEREGKRVAATVGMPVRTSDVLVTGADGSAGVTFSDNSLVSVGPTASSPSTSTGSTRPPTRASSRGRCAKASSRPSPARWSSSRPSR